LPQRGRRAQYLPASAPLRARALPAACRAVQAFAARCRALHGGAIIVSLKWHGKRCWHEAAAVGAARQARMALLKGTVCCQYAQRRGAKARGGGAA